ncbi:MAG: lycopene cyclase domain-containing protein [Caldimonas sp.]
MKQHYVWLVWSSAFLIPWGVLYVANPGLRSVMWRVSLVTALFGVTEPLFVPAYWNPPSLFELAQRTGFDIESLIFAFAIGGIGAVLYDTLTRRQLVSIDPAERAAPTHRLHLTALLLPFVAFVPLYFLPWNPIYPVLVCLVLGALASVWCRPELKRKTLIGGLLFFGLYAVFMLGLKWFAPGYIEAVWNLGALRAGLVYGIPAEELLFGFAFGLYWSGVYEHFSWSTLLIGRNEDGRLSDEGTPLAR